MVGRLLQLAGGAVLWAAATVVCATPESSPATGTTLDDGAAKYLQGLQLLDQDGQQVDLYQDLIAGHSVVLHSFFAHCADSCPVVINTLKSLQSRLGPRLEREVRLISITVDPGRDNPAALKAYAQRIGAKPGWHFLSGTSEQVGAALRRIGQYTDDPAAHMNLVVLGNQRTGLWKKVHGLAPAATVVELAMGVIDDSGSDQNAAD